MRWLWLGMLCALPMHGVGGQSPALGNLRGVVYDSVRARPLALATIQLVNERDRGRTRAAATDRLGRFSVDSLEPGVWIVGARHPWLDSIAVDQLGVLVEVKANSTSRASLAVPSGHALVSRVCGPAVAADSSGYVHGVLRRTPGFEDNTPGTVRIQWVEFTVRNARIERSLDAVHVESALNGRFVACGVPLGGTLRVRAWVGADSTGVLDFALPAHGIGQLDLLIGQANRTTMTLLASPISGDSVRDTLDATNIEVVRGTARIEGVALATTGGAGNQPLANARVTVWGTGLETRSASDGRFALSGLPTGSYLLETTAIGYQPSREIVELRTDATLTANTRLERLLMLDTVQVRAQRLRLLGPAMAGFEARRHRGLGKFLGPEELDKRVESQTSDLFAMMPGVYLVPGAGGDRVLLRGDFRSRCVPTVFIDGVRIHNPDGQDSLNDYVIPMDIRAIEVYVSAVMRPPEFTIGTSNCGSIVIWTGPRTR
ncbi:carboxypeptidase regulatory-like domain-containing protein [Gemmatimonas sp.]|uniref:carboxypeptidase regulatory-like domain-containing protein n=1 Tax=Gemmatimonas sp. TaxID=1962908 RepID=UPI00286B8064|nr:carboxypeptidase regulatory-like domain-containing protein [Gemmatimonas sp.]